MNCKFSKIKKTKEIIHFGSFPVCHKFSKGEKKIKNYKLGLSYCGYCNLFQISKPFPLKELKPIYDWINYNEPEEHLDKLVNTISKLKYVNKKSTISGVSYKEISTISRFFRKGYNKNWILNPYVDLKIKDKKHNLETIQKKISSLSNFKNLKKTDVLIVRHILEHCYDIKKFINNLKKMVKKNGYIVFEVPDCEQSFLKRDYVMMWEEHIFYFTKKSLLNLLDKAGFKIEYFERYKYSYESILIAIVSIKNDSENRPIYLSKTKVFFNNKNLDKDRLVIKNKIKKFKEKNYNVCMFGTGHSALTFINIFKLEKHIDMIIDDDENKTDMNLPGSSLKIKNSKVLKSMSKTLIFLGVNSESEKKIVSKVNKYNLKVKYFSVYRNSKYNLFKYA